MSRVVAVPFTPVALTTAAVYRVVDQDRSAFVKILQNPRHCPLVALLPADQRDRLEHEFPWRDEAEFLSSGFELPPGMRMPRVYRLDELGDGRLAMWLEDVAVADVDWDEPRFARAAYLLGRWAGRRAGGPPGPALRILADARVNQETVRRLETREQRALAERVPELLDRLDALPQARCHGDACPQNLLVPHDEPDSFVVIDVGWQCPFPIGMDLGQLLVGLIDAGTLAVSALPNLHEIVVDAYLDGLRTERHSATREQVAFGCDAGAVIRSAFHSGPELSAYLMALVD